LLLVVDRRLDPAARAAAARLARSPMTGAALEALAGGRVVAFGDSLTASPCSWAEILRHALRLTGVARPAELVNLGIAGDTTVHLVSRFADVAACQPELLIVMAGTNDARRHGCAAARMLVPDRETRHNLRLLRILAREQTRARLVFVTPPPVLERRIERAPLLRAEPVAWREADVTRKAAIVAALEGDVIDSRVALRAPLGSLLLADGLHLSLRGQERLARWIVTSLSPPRSAAAAAPPPRR
jgi:lysophospholipase L1-like esterase